MTGIEYELLHAMEPILYVIRKQNRHSPTQGNLQTVHLFITIMSASFLFSSLFVISIGKKQVFTENFKFFSRF